MIWPKLFRRIVPYLAAGNTTFDGFDAWLRADPVHRDDRLLFANPIESGNMHDVVAAAGNQIQLTRWPEDFVIEPDPPTPGTTTGRRRYTAGDVVIVAAVPDPVGADLDHESASLLNVTPAEIDLQGWNLTDRARHPVSGFGVLAVLPGMEAKTAPPRFGHAQIVLPAQRICQAGRIEAQYREDRQPWPPPRVELRQQLLDAVYAGRQFRLGRQRWTQWIFWRRARSAAGD
ncbi:MAG TPA: hypothetical protein VHR64_07930 [Thermomicrobiales bacterium]|nr:hypothetical protein [Thermomicrobiales bacterium]